MQSTEEASVIGIVPIMQRAVAAREREMRSRCSMRKWIRVHYLSFGYSMLRGAASVPKRQKKKKKKKKKRQQQQQQQQQQHQQQQQQQTNQPQRQHEQN